MLRTVKLLSFHSELSTCCEMMEERVDWICDNCEIPNIISKVTFGYVLEDRRSIYCKRRIYKVGGEVLNGIPHKTLKAITRGYRSSLAIIKLNRRLATKEFLLAYKIRWNDIQV